MKIPLESFDFTVPLGVEAHLLAERFRRHQSNPQKGKQVYVNTLAVYAVNFYLRCMGIETNWEASDSYDPMMQSFMDVADLEVPHLGRLECRPVLPGTQVIEIPPEVCCDRIAYVVVQMTESLKEATLLGFTETAATETLGLEQLRSLAEFPPYLHQLRHRLAANTD